METWPVEVVVETQGRSSPGSHWESRGLRGGRDPGWRIANNPGLFPAEPGNPSCSPADPSPHLPDQAPCRFLYAGSVMPTCSPMSPVLNHARNVLRATTDLQSRTSPLPHQVPFF